MEKQRTKFSFRQHWLSLLGVLFGIIGIVLSVYFYWAAQRSREPTFLVEPIRTQILRANEVANSRIRVLKEDGTEIASDLYAIRFYFWNAGKEPIRREHVLEPIVITLDDDKAEILDLKILAESRAVVGLELAESGNEAEEPARSISVRFRILEYNDGFAAQVIYQGGGNAPFRIAGTVQEATILQLGVRSDVKLSFIPIIIPVGITLIIASSILFYGMRIGKRRLAFTLYLLVLFIGALLQVFVFRPIDLSDQVPPELTRIDRISSPDTPNHPRIAKPDSMR